LAHIYKYDQNAIKMLPVNLKEGRLPQNEGEIVLEEWMLGVLPDEPEIGDIINIKLGNRETINKSETNQTADGKKKSTEAFSQTGEAQYKIVGLIDTGFTSNYNFRGVGITYLDVTTMKPDDKCRIHITLENTRGALDKANGITKDTGVNGEFEYNDGLLRLSAEGVSDPLNKTIYGFSTFMVAIIIICTVAVIYNSFNISVMERVTQYGLIRCIGATPKQIRSLVLREAWLLGAIGIPVGVLGGIFAMNIVFYVVRNLSNNLAFFKTIQVVIYPPVIILSVLLGAVTVFLSAYGPARKAGRITPIEAARKSDFYKMERKLNKRKGKLLSSIFGFEGLMAAKNNSRQKKRFRITVFSLVISIVLYIVFGSMVSFLYKMNIVPDKIPIDYIVENVNSIKAGIEESVYEEIKHLDGVKTVFKERNQGIIVNAPIDKLNKRFMELDYISQAKIEKAKQENTPVALVNSKLVSYGDDAIELLVNRSYDIDLDKMNRERSVLVIQEGALYDNLNKRRITTNVTEFKEGDFIEISLPSVEGELQESFRFKVEKIITVDKENGIAQRAEKGGITVFCTEGVVKEITGNEKIDTLYIKAVEGASRDSISSYLTRLTERNLEYMYTDISELAKSLNNDFAVLGIFFYGFIIVVSLIGFVNIVNTISTNIILRTRELAMLKAVGMSNSGLKKMIYTEGLMYGIYASVIGVIVGSILSYILFSILTGVSEFVWEFPLEQVLVASGGAIILSLISGYLPIKRINESVIVENMKFEE